jgi:hypothetical protein
VYCVISWFEKKWRQGRVEVEGLSSKYVDGIWVQAVIQLGEVKELTELTISSSVANGFGVVGKAPKVNNKGDLVKSGSFSAIGGRTLGSGFGFVFSGNLGGQALEGVAYYKFEERDENGKPAMSLNGAFYESISDGVYDVHGYRIGDHGKVSNRVVQAAMKDWRRDPIIQEACTKSGARR